MRKDFQEVQRDALIEEIVSLIDYAEGDLVANQDESGREVADIEINWADEDLVRMAMKCALSMKRVQFMDDEKSKARAERIFACVREEERTYLLCFVFGIMTSRITRSDVRLMVAWARESRDRKKEKT